LKEITVFIGSSAGRTMESRINLTGVVSGDGVVIDGLSTGSSILI